MEDIFILTHNGLKINDEMVMLYPSFNSIYKRDHNQDKRIAFKELTYVYIMSDFKSPGIKKGLKGVKLHNYAVDFAKLDSSYVADGIVNEAIDIYRTERGGIITDLYKSILAGFNTSKQAIDLLNQMTLDKLDAIANNNVDFTTELVKALTSSVKELISLSTDLPQKIEHISEVIKKVHLEQSNKRKARGDIEITDSMNPNRRR